MEEKRLGDLNIYDTFFNSFKQDYFEFDKWINRNKNRICYVNYKDNKLVSLLVLKIEDNEDYYDFDIPFKSSKRLKVCTLKVSSIKNGIGTSYIKKIKEYKDKNNIDEVYITVYEKYSILIDFLVKNGFKYYGDKNTLDGNNILRKEKIYIWI